MPPKKQTSVSVSATASQKCDNYGNQLPTSLPEATEYVKDSVSALADEAQWQESR